jgi:hypothetical protein
MTGLRVGSHPTYPIPLIALAKLVPSQKPINNPKPIQLSEITGFLVQFWFSPFRTLNQTIRTVLLGSGSGSEIFLNWTDGPVWGSGKSTPEPD